MLASSTAPGLIEKQGSILRDTLPQKMEGYIWGLSLGLWGVLTLKLVLNPSSLCSGLHPGRAPESHHYPLDPHHLPAAQVLGHC